MGGSIGGGWEDSSLNASYDILAVELVDWLVVGRLETRMSPMVSLIASAIFIDLLRSSSLIEVSLESFGGVSSSSANPAAYISIASSTVILSTFETGLDC